MRKRMKKHFGIKENEMKKCPTCGKDVLLTGETYFSDNVGQFCEFNGYHPPYTYAYTNNNYGWICPKRGRANSPSISSCPCSDVVRTYANTQ